MNRYEKVRAAIRNELTEELDFSTEIADADVENLIDEKISEASKTTYLSLTQRMELSKELFYAIRRLDVLQDLIADETVTEIMVNGADCIFVERRGTLSRYERHFESREKLEDVIQQIIAGSNRVVNESMPIVDARLPNGARVNVVLSPVALNGPILTIRRFPDNPILMKDLLQFHSITEEAAEFLKKLVTAGYNIFISGGTGSGKTTFLNALSQFIPKEERIITIEDSAELQIQGIENLVRMETRNANVKGCEPISIRDLIKTSLRMRPDRIIVGEVRGSEAIDMLQALNTGHDGSLSTGHANSSRDMLSRLETMVLMGMELPLAAIRRQIASGIDIIVHLGRMRDRTRKVLEIVEILDYQDGEIKCAPLFQFWEKDGLKKCGSLTHKEKLISAGISLEEKDEL